MTLKVVEVRFEVGIKGPALKKYWFSYDLAKTLKAVEVRFEVGSKGLALKKVLVFI